MRCPFCTEVPLQATDRLGVEIDYCPNCRGIWLHREELEKILHHRPEKTAAPPSDPTAAPKRRRKTWFEKLLDF